MKNFSYTEDFLLNRDNFINNDELDEIIPENTYSTDMNGISKKNLLQLIRNSETAEVFKCRKNQVSNETLSSADLFKQGDEFTISKFKKQFVNGNSNTMNSGLPLGFTFNVKTLTNSEATIEITAL